MSGEGGQARPAPVQSEFYGSAHRLQDVGRQRHPKASKVQAVCGPISLTVAGDTWQLEGLQTPAEPGPCEAALRELVGGQRVLIEPTSEGRAYVRLKNRSMINSRLIRLGLADPDPGRVHRNRTRFMRYAAERE
jgi:hypothetical protein